MAQGRREVTLEAEKKDNTKLYVIVGGIVACMFMLLLAVGIGAGAYIYVNHNAHVSVPTPVNPIDTFSSVSDEDAAKLCALYTAMSDVIEGDTDKAIKTTQDVRQANAMAGRLALGDSLKGKYPGLAQAIDAEIEKALGKQNVTLSDEKRVAASTVFDQIAGKFKR